MKLAKRKYTKICLKYLIIKGDIMKKSSKIVALSLLTALSLNMIGPMQKQVYAAELLDFGVKTESFTPNLVRANIKQDKANKEKTLQILRNVRSRMWDENIAYTMDDSNPNNMKLRDYLKTQGINSKEQYLNSITWSTDHERLAVQRGFEVKINGLNHNRPDGSSYETAVLPNGTKIASEIIAWNNMAMDPEIAINQWTFNPRSKYNNMSEYDLLKESNGVYNNKNGHMHIILDPSFKTVGFASINSNGDYYGVAEFGINAPSGSDSLNYVGEYEMKFGKVQEESNNTTVDKEAIKEKLKAAIDRSNKTISAAELILGEYPNTIAEVKPEVEKLLIKYKAQRAEAERRLKAYNNL